MSRVAPVLHGLAAPPVLGAAYVTLLTVFSLAASYGDDRVQGVEVHSLRALVESGYRDEVYRVVALCLALAALTGLLLGAVAWIVTSARARLASLTAPKKRSALLLTALAHAAWVARDAAARPQLYEDWLYQRGGVRRALHLLLTDWLGPRGVTLLFAAGLSIWLLLPALARSRSLRIRERALQALAQPRTPIMASVFAALFIVTLIAARPRTPDPAPEHGRLNVLLIGVDSLRDDRFEPRVMPELSRLAARGTRFERAYVSLPRTFPSWVTILTGRHPHHHGIRNMFPSWEARSAELSALPQRLARAGYETLVVGDFAADIFRRIELGFSRVEAPTFNFRELIRVRVLASQPAILPLSAPGPMRQLVPSYDEIHDAADPALLSARALNAISSVKREPFFATVFFSAAHFPYAAPSPYYRRFSDPGYRGRFKYGKANLLGREAAPDAADVRQIRAAYDGAVSAVDAAIGELVAGLEARGLAERTVIVVTADHGESLYENGRAQGHGDHLFGDETTHVPLLIIDPRRPGARSVRQLVRDVDLAPTLSELTGIDAPPEGDGRSLAPALAGNPLPPALAYAETGLWFTETVPDVPRELRIPYPDLTHMLELHRDHGDDLALRPELELLTRAAKHRMVRDERYKLVYVPTRSGAKYRLFDTLNDPAEIRDVAVENPEVLRRLSDELWRFMLSDRAFERRADLLVPREPVNLTATEQQRGLRLEDPAP